MYQSHIYLDVRILASTKKQDLTQNKEVVSLVFAAIEALNCKKVDKIQIEKLSNTLSVPENYGFTGVSVKLAEMGELPISFHRRSKKIRIEEIRLEEDAGRLTHSSGKTRMDYTYVGCPSLRIKTKADFELGEEAELFLQALGRLIQYLGITKKMPVESAIRCNAYVALSKYPLMPDYYVKLRNLNSFNFVRKAINSELTRQEEILISNGIVNSESRLWNEKQNFTESYKTRSTSDVRQFVLAPENLANSVIIDLSMIKDTRENSLPVELPEDRCARFCRQYDLSRMRAENICDERDRSDFFEQSVSFGCDARDAAHWITSELLRLLKWNNKDVRNDTLTPKRFARIIQLFHEKQIHSGIAKQLLQKVLETGLEPDELIEKNQWKQIGNEKDLLKIIKPILAHNPQECEKLRRGDMAPLEFLTGLVMKATHGMAVPQTVKNVIKKELNIRIVFILSCGGAICGSIDREGEVQVGDEKVLRSMIEQFPTEDESIRYQIVPVGKLLSEEIEPADWSVLISEIANKITVGTATGIVVTHGTDTLSYTASLLFWLFADANVPIVLTASSTTPDESDEGIENLKLASSVACHEKSGVYVVYGGKVLSPLNLKFEHTGTEGFSNWNISEQIYTSSGPISTVTSNNPDFETFVSTRLLRSAADSLFICKVYPGLKAERYCSLIEEGVKNFILELYETGTGSMRTGDYSLKSLLIKGRKKGCRFYCTSQQQCSIDFSLYSTSRRVWREGAIPMGRLTTESVISLFYAANLVADSDTELDQLMESYAELYS